MQKQKVFVGMSGGVDSSVSALLLKNAGYEVVGVFIKVWQADFLPCTWREERRDAMRAAAHIGIPFLTLDLEKEYKEEVVDYMVREYKEGRIPNPDVMCNKHVKFGAFLSFAKDNGADFIATGHYARTNNQEGRTGLLAGVDLEKDQSYFLWTLNHEVLSNVLFPIGELLKSEVRNIALESTLPNAEKKDSQGLCFMGPVNMEDFLKHYLKTEIGNVLNEKNEVIGTHQGSELYTIGQRHGFSTEKHSPSDTPYFVSAKNIINNTITVHHRNPKERAGVSMFLIEDALLPENMNTVSDVFVRIRYRGTLFPCTLTKTGEIWKVSLESPLQDIAPGQSAVFYRGEHCIGGGVIAS